MSLIGVFVVAVALIFGCGRLLADTPDRAAEAKPGDGSAWIGVLIFAALLVGTIARKRKQDGDD